MHITWLLLSHVTIEGGDTVKEAMAVALEDLLLYNKDSVLVLLFLVALVFLWLVERDRRIRTILLYLSIALFAVFLCPVYAWIGQKIDEEIYYRVFWTLPIGLLFCYGSVQLLNRMKKTISRVLVGILLLLVICMNGKLVYKTTHYIKATNAYHVPQIVIDVAEAIRMEKYKPIAVLPSELLPFLRQYTGDVFTPYGRNIVVERWNFNSELYDAMEAEIYDAEEIAMQARKEHCAFVVLSAFKQMNGSMEEQNYFLKDCVNGIYNVYMDYNYYNVYLEQNLLDDDMLKYAK